MSDTSPASIKRDNMEMMQIISKDQQSLEDIRNLTSSKVTDQLKVFLIAQARNELSRVIKLTQFLDKLEANFMGKVETAMTSDDLTLKQYSEIIGVITSLLSRSNEIVSKVLNDDSLTTILNTTIYTTGGEVQSTSVVSNLKDSQSRERVRVVLQQIINNTANYQPAEQTTDYVVVSSEEESQ